MNWWRAHHGLAYDAKVGIVARRIGARRTDVGMVWIACLEYASQAEERGERRGSVEGIDPAVVGFGLDLDPDEVQRIMRGLEQQGLIIGGRLSGWERRNPIREDPTAADRQRARRERCVTDRDHGSVTQCHAPSRVVTQESDESRLDKRREEEIRGEEKTHTQTRVCSPHSDESRIPLQRRRPAAPDMDAAPSQRFEEFWDKYPRKVGRDSAAQDWLSVVTADIEEQVLACLDRYLASDEVRRGAVMNAGSSERGVGWLIRCHRDGWTCDWPRPREPARAMSRQERMLERANELMEMDDAG